MRGDWNEALVEAEQTEAMSTAALLEETQNQKWRTQGKQVTLPQGDERRLAEATLADGHMFEETWARTGHPPLDISGG